MEGELLSCYSFDSYQIIRGARNSEGPFTVISENNSQDESATSEQFEPQRVSEEKITNNDRLIIENNIVGGDIVGGDKIGGDRINGDKFEVGNISEQSIVVQGRGAQATLKVFNINLRLLPIVLLLVLAVITLAYLLLKSLDKPNVMDAEFNVAIAEFLVVDDKGSQQRSEEGLNFAKWLHERLSKSFEAELTDLSGTYEVWSPENTGIIRGNTPEGREDNAQKRAEEINADVIIYGVIQTNEEKPEDSEVQFEFYVNERGFEEGQEIIGQYNLGSPMLVSLPFNKNDLQDIENPGLSARAQALTLITIGLSYYAIDNFENSVQYFHQAESIKEWFNNHGKEVVHMLLGNAYSRWSSREKTQKYIPQSREHYLTALDINDDYARAQVGLAGTIYLEALGDPTNPSFDDTDGELLMEAEQAFKQALTMEENPASANIESKVHFSLGQIYLTRYVMEQGLWLTRARNEFEKVVTEFKNGNNAIKELTAHAYARLGRIDFIEGNSANAISHYELAVEYASPFYQSQYQSSIGDIYASICELDRAMDAYNRAFQKAVQFGESLIGEQINEKIAALDNLDC